MEKRYIITALVAFILVLFSAPILSVIMTLLEVVFAAITFVGAFGIMVAIAWVVFEYVMDKSKDFIKKVK